MRGHFRGRLGWTFVAIAGVVLVFWNTSGRMVPLLDASVFTGALLADNCSEPAVWLARPPRGSLRSVVISVVLWKRFQSFKKMFYSLCSSDVFKSSNVHLVVYLNQAAESGLQQKLYHLLQGARGHRFVSAVSFTSNGNDGVVVARMCVMQYALSVRKHWNNFLVEVDEDTIFPDTWFEALMEFHRPGVGVLMPFVWSGFEASPVPLTNAVKPLTQRLVYQNCIPLRPWVIDLDMVRQIGYFDKQAGSRGLEDADFYFRVIRAGHVALSIKLSWVGRVHVSLTSSVWRSVDEKTNYFRSKWKMSVGEFARNVLSQCDGVFDNASTKVTETVQDSCSLLQPQPSFGQKIQRALNGDVLFLSVIGTRPEAVKMAPVVLEIEKHSGVVSIVVATSQHVGVMLHDILGVFNVSVDISFGNLRAGLSLSGAFAHMMEQMGCLTLRLKGARPVFVVVQGDTTSAAAIALTSFFHGIPVAHVEAGLRTYDLSQPFPEELNRQLISTLATMHFAPTNFSHKVLLSEGTRPGCAFVVGNPVIDAIKFGMEYIREKPRRLPVVLKEGEKLVLLTCHRRENIQHMPEIFDAVTSIVDEHPEVVLLFPVHPNPRVVAAAKKHMLHPRIHLLSPFGFLDQVSVLTQSWMIITDSGGIQEEATAVGRTCLVLRDTTERPESVIEGTTILVGRTRSGIVAGFHKVYANAARTVLKRFPFGVGDTGKRIARLLLRGAREGKKLDAGRTAPLGRSFFEDGDYRAAELTALTESVPAGTMLNQCGDAVHCLKKGDITVILTVYKRNTTSAVLDALFAQTVPPTKVFIWQNGEFQNLDWVRKSKFSTQVEIVRSSHNFKFHGRFLLPLLFDSQFTMVLDDDMLPGEQTVERMRDACIFHKGLIGINGRIVNDLKNYRTQTLVGDGNGKSSTQMVDYVGHGWFFQTEWVRMMWQNRHFSIVNAEDIAFSASVKMFGNIDSYVIGRTEDPKTWPDQRREWGADAVSSWRLEQRNWDSLRLNAILFFKARGWRLLRIG